MHTNLLIGVGPLVLVIGSSVGLVGFLCYPLFKVYPDDRGDGNALVLLPPPKNPPLYKGPLYVALFTGLVVLSQSIQGPAKPSQLYFDAVTRISGMVVQAPIQVSSYASEITVALRFLIVGSILTLALAGRGTIPRRMAVMASALIYLPVMIMVDSVLSVLETLTGLSIGPSSLIGTFAALLFGFIAITRSVLANYSLPRPASLPFVPRPRLSDALTLILLTLAAMAVAVAGFLLVDHYADAHYRALAPILLPVPFGQVVLIVRTLLMAILLKITKPPEPPPGVVRAPIDIIIPAYNEEEVIVGTLRSIDVAAGRHGGPVTVILCDDGSTDRTRELVEATMRSFRYARGRVVDGTHGGKSAALNAALAHATTDIVVRIDADTMIDEWSLYYTQRWFADPQIGLVEALMWPRWNSSVYPRMRQFEELRQFGMYHRTIQLVDGVNVVPGVFTAFRRDIALQIDGFTDGMNGEDGDFTLRFSRVGYRTHMDPKILIYEDVPSSYMELREQRLRWGRATIHNHARHGPYRAGLATSKVWFSQTHLFYTKVFSSIRVMIFFYLFLVAVFEGVYRAPILTFLGFYVVSKGGLILLDITLASGYRKIRYIPWAILIPVWGFFMAFFSVESWLSLPGRPVKLFGEKAAPISAPVIH